MISQADTAVLKRLVFEGHTMVLGQLRELVRHPNPAASRKLPALEREHRMTQLKQRLQGVIVEMFSFNDWLQENGNLPWENEETAVTGHGEACGQWLRRSRTSQTNSIQASCGHLKLCADVVWWWTSLTFCLGNAMNGTFKNWPATCVWIRLKIIAGRLCSRSSRPIDRSSCSWSGLVFSWSDCQTIHSTWTQSCLKRCSRTKLVFIYCRCPKPLGDLNIRHIRELNLAATISSPRAIRGRTAPSLRKERGIKVVARERTKAGKESFPWKGQYKHGHAWT